MAANNEYWNLEDFIDSLVVELDKTRETLAVKAINKPLTYTVHKLGIDLNIFPTYDGDAVKFITAQPGQDGASKVSIELGSITDQQVRATTKMSGLKNDVKLDDVQVDTKTKKQLRKLGVTSVDDLQQVEKKNVDIQKVSDNEIDYKSLANQIQKSRRNSVAPQVKAVSLSSDNDRGPHLKISGKNLTINPSYTPVAVINNRLAEVLSFGRDEVLVKIERSDLSNPENQLILTFDPYAVVRMNLRNQS